MCAAYASGSWINAVFDEIALEGLDGTTLPSLWPLLSIRLYGGKSLPDKLHQQIWMLLLRSTREVSFFILPEARPLMPLYKRTNDQDVEIGMPVIPESCPFLRLPFAPVQDGNIRGNCKDYKTRRRISVGELKALSAAEATEKYQQKLVVVANQELRLKALKPANMLLPRELTVQHYVFLETVGRSRYNGETTRGPWSLTNYFSDPSFIFYLKNGLQKQQLVVGQAYTERHNGRNLISNLVMLPRFFRIYKTYTQVTMEKFYTEIKASPHQYIPSCEVLERIPDLSHSRLKKLLVSHTFRKIFETALIYPPGSAGSGSKPQSKGRKMSIVRLRNPNMEFDDLNQLDQTEEREDKAPDELLSQRHAHVNMPLELECLRAIKHFGTRGMSTLELGQYVSINFQIARGVIKYLIRKKRIKSYTETSGKSRITRFVAVGTQAEAIYKEKEEQLEKSLLQLQCQDEPTIPKSVDITVNDVPSIKANVRVMEFSLKLYKGSDKETPRHVARKIIIVRQIDKNCIVNTIDLARAVMESEKNIGTHEKICRKSLFRLLERMQRMRIVNVYEVTLEYEQNVRLYRLVTHPKIDLQHDQLKREVLRLKNNFHLITEERLLRPAQLLRGKERREQMERKKLRLERQPQDVPKPSAPKLLVACVLHEFLFYLQCEQQRGQTPLQMNEELLQRWQRSEPSLMTREYLEEWQATESEVLPYTQEISWRTFIPPLPNYEKPSGWLYFMDALERMPLSLMLRIFRIDRDVVEKLRPQLQHPVRQHYLLQQLQLQNLIPRFTLQQRYVGMLRLLNNMGLLQVSERQAGRDSLQRWVYLNKRTSLLDTTTSSGHNYKKINPDLTYERLTYEFTSREQVANYWAKLQHVCIYTKLGFLKHRERKVGGRKEKRLPSLSFVRTTDFEEAEKLDDGSVPGDQQGAAGLSSSLFAHQFRHWSWVKRNSVPAPRSTASNGRKATTSIPTRKRLSLVRLKPVPRFGKTRGASSAETRKRKTGPRDDIDRDALRNMRTLRVTWCPAEDRILKMGRAVYLFIDAPLPALALYSVGIICRDVIRRYLNINNKTTQACVRRLQFLIRMKRDQPDVRNWIYMMQSHPEFNAIYNERFLPQLKQEYPARSEQVQALLIHFVIILERLHRLIINEDCVYRQFLLPDNLEDYRSRFRECVGSNGEQDMLLYANPKTETDLQITVVFCVQHSLLCCSKDKTLFNLQAFEIYKHYSEDVLNAAFKKARADSLLVAVKRRHIQHVHRLISGPGHLLSSKYKYRLVCQKYGYLVYEAYYAFERRFHESPGLTSLDLPSPNFAQLLLLGEWVANNWLNLTLQLPVNILNVDTTSMPVKTAGSASDRILDHYSSIFDNAPQTEYSKRLESVCSGRPASRVRFHPANLTYRLQSSIYNQLNKLPMRTMHFFCALDALGQSVNISCARLEHGECPFSCIMHSGNYLNAVERIIYEHRAILRQLVADALPQVALQLQLDSSTSSSTTLTVSTGNLIALVEQLEQHWRQLQQPQEVKDLGKRLADSTLHKKTDWHSLCSALLTYEAGKEDSGERAQDYEPSLNKEERARAQDVFVVHLPTIHMQELEHPQLQARQDELRKAVLDKVVKASFWRYTDNSFETLLPTLEGLNYEAQAIQQVRDILEHIQEYPLGVEGVSLRRSFPLGEFLLEALQQLEAHDLIKRVGVASYMYVHKAHMRNWVVHTFHIKRLERERVQNRVSASPATLPGVVGQKRQMVDQSLDLQPSCSKKARLDEEPQQSSGEDTDSEEALLQCARRSKRMKKSETKTKTEMKSDSEALRDVIAIRPHPWIRVNASLNRRVLDRWMGALLSECITRNGCTVHSLFLRFPHLLPVDTMLLLELLCDLGCLRLVELEPPTVHLESSYDDDLQERPVTILYDPKYTYVKVQTDAIGQLTNFIGLKKYTSEFI
ncbi:PREDICTED: general transcription factor 3C polypeptide 1 isoform X1 [Drosophila arizonae]|uniref:General transcription factor 3C polypeptide 1 isoform X1 n=3 Tax=Drosophila arizonae TaxID=7263 RepID=A0ABM1NRP1_DROAR|nr:PREDICTED: general transcription factor 3C polypeptide 1 isoform X1 [Drosophila arizonae]